MFINNNDFYKSRGKGSIFLKVDKKLHFKTFSFRILKNFLDLPVISQFLDYIWKTNKRSAE